MKEKKVNERERNEGKIEKARGKRALEKGNARLKSEEWMKKF